MHSEDYKMSTQSLYIDNDAFAKNQEQLTGILTLADCLRLSAFLASQVSGNLKEVNNAIASKNNTQESIHFTLEGESDALGRHFLHLILVIDLMVVCQRCMDAMPINLNLNFSYLICDAQEISVTEESDEHDLQEASESMDLIALIEDEIMMAMPIAPTHQGACDSGVMQSGDKPNPFAVLKDLIKS